MTNLAIVIIEGKQKSERMLRSGEQLRFRRGEKSDNPHQTPDELLSLRTATQYCSNSPRVSQSHAEMRNLPDGRILIKDLGSTNGTFVRLSPFQEYELPDYFELLVGPDLLVQRQTPLWETDPSPGSFANAEDLVAHLKIVLKAFVQDIRMVSLLNFEPPAGLYTKLPIVERQAYLIVQWHNHTFNLAIERWLQRRVLLFNSGSVEQPLPADDNPWTFTAASGERRQVLQLARRVAPTNGTALLIGASGTGKEVLAKDLHDHSLRRKGPFIPVNCAALPKELIASELFGTARGAFTGAFERLGLFERANGGTLFLDEIGELPIDVQATLLRVLEERKVRRIGENEERKIDVRIIAATNRDLQKMVAANEFRGDLYFRLGAVPLVLPALQPADVMSIVPQLFKVLVKRDGFSELLEDEVMHISRCAASASWPGNARELRNVLQRYLTYRDADADPDTNWHVALSANGHLRSPTKSLPVAWHGTSPAQLPPGLMNAPEPEAMPAGLMKKLMGHLDRLLFLDFARQVLLPWHRGNLTKLGDKLGMTGAGATARLKQYGLRAEVDGLPPDAAQFDALIQAERTALQQNQVYLRRLLGF